MKYLNTLDRILLVIAIVLFITSTVWNPIAWGWGGGTLAFLLTPVILLTIGYRVIKRHE
jgi:membrane protein implicated in regulation of membrane protease activity